MLSESEFTAVRPSEYNGLRKSATIVGIWRKNKIRMMV